jgi:hypothetical protein
MRRSEWERDGECIRGTIASSDAAIIHAPLAHKVAHDIETGEQHASGSETWNSLVRSITC